MKWRVQEGGQLSGHGQRSLLSKSLVFPPHLDNTPSSHAPQTSSSPPNDRRAEQIVINIGQISQRYCSLANKTQPVAFFFLILMLVSQVAAGRLGCPAIWVRNQISYKITDKKSLITSAVLLNALFAAIAFLFICGLRLPGEQFPG